MNAVWLCAHWPVHQSSLRHFWVTEEKRWVPLEDVSGSMCPRTDEQQGRRSTVGQPELVLSFPLPCMHYHFLLNFHLHFHYSFFTLLWVSLLPLFGSSMIPAFALHLLVSIDCFLFRLLNEWPLPDASWDMEKGQMSIMPPGQALLRHTPIPCAIANWHSFWPAHNTKTTCGVHFLWFDFFRVVLFWERL